MDAFAAPTMSGLQKFLQQRQQSQRILHNHETGDGFKVSVPIAKLELPESQSLALRSNNSVTVNHPSIPQNPRQEPSLRLSQTLDDRIKGFDTDAEGLDDTTIMSSAYDSKVVQGNVLSVSFKGHRKTENSNLGQQAQIPHWQWRHNRSLGQLEAEDKVLKREHESCEESGEDIEGDEGHSNQELVQAVIQKHDSSGFSRSRREISSLSKTSKQLIESFAVRDNDYKRVREQPPITDNPLPLHVRKPKSDAVESNVNWRRKDLRKSPASVGNTKLLKTQQTNHGPGKVTARLSPPIASVDQLVPKSASTMLVPSTLFEQQEVEPMEEPVIPAMYGNYLTGGKDNKILSKEKALCPGLTASTGNLRPHLSNEVKKKASREGTSFSTGYAGSSDNESLVDRGTSLSTGSQISSGGSGRDNVWRTRGKDLDYSSDQLAGMEFQQLNQEPFHIDPQASKLDLPADITRDTLRRKLDHLLKVDDDDTRTGQQGAFMDSLPIQKYEECGNIIVEKFSALIQRFKNARQERRKIVVEFEEEIARREGCIQDKVTALEEDFDRLKRSGEDVVKKRLAI